MCKYGGSSILGLNGVLTVNWDLYDGVNIMHLKIKIKNEIGEM